MNLSRFFFLLCLTTFFEIAYAGKPDKNKVDEPHKTTKLSYAKTAWKKQGVPQPTKTVSFELPNAAKPGKKKARVQEKKINPCEKKEAVGQPLHSASDAANTFWFFKNEDTHPSTFWKPSWKQIKADDNSQNMEAGYTPQSK